MQMTQIARILSLVVGCCCAVSYAQAQVVTRSTDTSKKLQPLVQHPKPKGPKPIKHEVSGGIRLNSDGWSIYSDIGKVKTKDVRHADMFHNVRIWQIEFTEKKNPKEQKIDASDGSGSNTYVYGKINNFYSLKLGWGFRKMLVGKPDPGTVSIHWVNVGGFALGLLKPYYINVYSDPSAIKYTDATKENFLNQGVIEGSAGFSKGLSEIKFVPGFHFKSALHFDFSANRKNVLGVETGFNIEYYTQAVQLLANQPAVPYFLDIFVGVQFGRRW